MSILSDPRTKFKANASDFGTTIAQALWQRAAQLCDYINKSQPIGTLMWMHATQEALPALPSSAYWQELDGSVVTNVGSPFYGITLPDFRDKFFMHPQPGDDILEIAGADSKTVVHNHSLNTGGGSGIGLLNLNDGNQNVEVPFHVHTISSDSMTFSSTLPPYIALKCYIRIV